MQMYDRGVNGHIFRREAVDCCPFLLRAKDEVIHFAFPSPPLLFLLTFSRESAGEEPYLPLHFAYEYDVLSSSLVHDPGDGGLCHDLRQKSWVLDFVLCLLCILTKELFYSMASPLPSYLTHTHRSIFLMCLIFYDF